MHVLGAVQQVRCNGTQGPPVSRDLGPLVPAVDPVSRDLKPAHRSTGKERPDASGHRWWITIDPESTSLQVPRSLDPVTPVEQNGEAPQMFDTGCLLIPTHT